MAGKIRVGIVGVGVAASFHFEDYRRVFDVPVEVVGVMSRTLETTQAFARERGIKAYATFEELCDAVDVLNVCTPSATHEAMTLEAFARGKDVIIEKPFTGYFGPATGDFRGDTFSKEVMLREAMASSERMLAAARKAGKHICYAENWVYAPAIQKEREILTKSGGQVLRIMADESHSGSASVYGGIWRHSGGGALVGKGCHPLSAALYLKRAEGQARGSEPIRPVKVSAHVHEITRLKNYRDEGFLRTSYEDVEDYCQTHVVFDDGTIADIFCSDLVLGGVHSWLEVFANNHRTRCNLNPVNSLETYNPREDFLKDVFVTARIGTKQGWTNPSSDFDWQQGYPQEFQDFVESIAHHREPLSGGELARDTVAVLYSAYLSAERNGADVEIPR